MRIAYLGQMADVATENGISKKIRSQAKAWMEAGHVVRYFALTPTDAVWPGFTPVEAELLARGRGIARMRRSQELARRIRAWHPDLIYFRYAYHSPGLPALFREIPTIAEINSDDLREYPLTLSRAKVIYHRLFRRRVLRVVAGLVTVTRELARRFEEFDRPTTVIGNGIDLADFTSLPVPPSGAPDQLVFVGSAGAPWHGLDRVGELARLRPEARIEVVGCTVKDWGDAGGGGVPPKNLRFHGHLARADYEPLLASATAAIGTLGLYRKQMEEACPLKVREYLAMGLPVIAAYKDTDVPPDADYYLRLPNSPAGLDGPSDKLAHFLAHWSTRRVPRAAIAHLDTARKERDRLAFFARWQRPSSE